MNKVSKGARIEREFEKLLQENGFITHRAVRTRFNRIDIFDRFDICAKSFKYPSSMILWCQISTQWKYGEDRKYIEEFPCGIYDIVIMVRKQDRKEFEIKIWRSIRKEWEDITLISILQLVEMRPYAEFIPYPYPFGHANKNSK